VPVANPAAFLSKAEAMLLAAQLVAQAGRSAALEARA
jgi:hypothetical protein